MGDNFNELYCNMSDTGIGTTSPVGIFPSGTSPYGVMDMAGNVLEWTNDLYQPYLYSIEARGQRQLTYERYVLRGGAFISNIIAVRCAYRYRYNPQMTNGRVGFRVVTLDF